MTGLPPYRRDVNTVFQSYALFPHLSVFENIAFGLRRRGVKGASSTRRVDEALELVGVAGLGEAQAAPALGRPAAARGARPGARQQPARPPPRRAARRARPEAPQADAARAQAHPARGRHHLRPRHARPGGGDDDGRPDRRHERGPDRAARHAERALRAARARRSSPASSASRTSSPAPSLATGVVRLDGGTEVRVPPAALAGRTGRVAVGVRPEKVCLGGGEANALEGAVAEIAYIGVSTSTSSNDRAGRSPSTSRTPTRRARPARAGEAVTLSWSPEATFVVDRDRRKDRMNDPITRRQLVRRAAAGGALSLCPRSSPPAAAAASRAAAGPRASGDHRGRRATAPQELADDDHDLELDALHGRPPRARARSSPRRPASRSTTSRTSSRTRSSSARSRARSRRASRSTATSSSRPRGCGAAAGSATSSRSTRARSRTSSTSRTPSRIRPGIRIATTACRGRPT